MTIVDRRWLEAKLTSGCQTSRCSISLQCTMYQGTFEKEKRPPYRIVPQVMIQTNLVLLNDVRQAVVASKS